MMRCGRSFWFICLLAGAAAPGWAGAMTIQVGDGGQVFVEAGHHYCYLQQDRHFKKIPVEIGRQNEDFAEVLSGLTAEDRISLVRPAPEDLM